MTSAADNHVTQGPPEGVDASELWTLLTTVPVPHRVVDFPRVLPNTKMSVGKLAIVPLNQQETIDAQVAAELYTREVLRDRKTQKPPSKDDAVSPGYESIFKNEASVQVLYRACRIVGQLDKPAFPSPKMVKARLTADEIGVLAREYNVTRATCGPIISLMTKDEQDAWLDALEAGGEAIIPFASLSLELSQELLMRSVERARSLRTASASPGGPPAGPSSASSKPNDSESESEPKVDVDEPADVPVDDPPNVKP